MRGEHEPIPRGVVGVNATACLRTGDVPANDRQPRTIEITCPPPHRFQKSLFLGAADAFVQVKADGHAGRTAGRHVKALGGGNLPGKQFGQMLQQVSLFQIRASGQIINVLNVFGAKSIAGKTAFVEGTVGGGVKEHDAQLLELIGVDIRP